MATNDAPLRVLITGACGYVGARLTHRLAQRKAAGEALAITATDIRMPPADEQHPEVDFCQLDIRDRKAVLATVEAAHPDVVVHLAAIVTPGKKPNRQLEYAVDVEGSHHILDACVSHGVGRIVVSSSGAAYGYHPDNPVPLTESDPPRGNRAFAYSDHKRIVEELLAEYRNAHPRLEQVILRIGTILGPTIRNQITALFDKPVLMGLRGSDSPFVFIWDEDLVAILERALACAPPGIYNVAGDGALTLSEIADRLHKPIVKLPPRLVRAALAVAHPLGVSQYGPEQTVFLQYRPVLDNHRLKTVFGYTPQKTSAEAFAAYLAARDGGA